MTHKNNATCPTCRKTLTATEIQFWLGCESGTSLLADNEAECFFCQEGGTAFENAALDYAESGGGQEMVNDLRAGSMYID